MGSRQVERHRVGRLRDADTGGHLHHLPGGPERTCHGVGEELRGPHRLVGIVGLDDDGKFVAANSADHRSRRGGAMETLGDGAEQFIAAVMPKRVIDLLEIVDIDERKTNDPFVRTALQRPLQRLQHLRAIGQTSREIRASIRGGGGF